MLIFNPPVPPRLGALKTFQTQLHVVGFGDGYTQRRPQGLNHIKEKWVLSWPYLSREQADELEDFARTVLDGRAFSYQFYAQGKKNYRLLEQSYKREWVAPSYDTISFEIEEVFDL